MSDAGRSDARRRDSDAACWHCGASVAALAMFCHECGALQPPRGDDLFARLGLAPRFDVDPVQLERQHAGFRERLSEARFAGRSEMERANAAMHREALDRARAALGDPWERARHLLALSGRTAPGATTRDQSPDGSAAWARLARASDPSELAPLIEDAGERMGECYVELAAAFRRDDLDRAEALVGEIGRLRRFIAEARLRRADLGGG